MDALFEQRIVQSSVLAAEALWTAADAYFVAKDRWEGPPLAALFLVLPLAFHQRSARTLSGKHRQGALYRALAENKEIPVRLQERVESMAANTWRALNLALATDLVRLGSHPPFEVTPVVKALPFRHSDQDVKVIVAASNRVGHSLAELGLPQTCILLGVRF